MNIGIQLNKNFTTAYNKMMEEFGTDIADINGFSDEQLSYTDFIDNFIDRDTVADSSIDGNSNVAHKDIVTLEKEMSKPHAKLLAFNKIYYEIQKKFGFKAANEWLRAEWVGELYLHDANTSSMKSYCFRGDTKIITKDGIKSLVDLVGQEVQVFNKNKEWENATIKHFGVDTLRRLILEKDDNEKEIFVTGNHRWFVVQDSEEIVEIETDSLTQGMKIPYNSENTIGEYWIVKLVEDTGVEEDVYCAIAATTHSFTLEDNVLTHNCFAYDLKDLAEKGLYFIDGQNAKPAEHLITFVDFIKEFVSFSSNRTSGAVGLPNIIPYMFYFWKKDINSGYYTKDPEYYARQNFQRFIYAVNQPYVRDGSQSAFTNTSVFDRPYFEALFGGAIFPDGSPMIEYEEEIIEFQKWYMEVMSEIRSTNMFTFPVSTISLLRQNGKFVDEDFARWAIEHNMKWSDSNLFIDDSVTSLSNCCFDGSQMTLSKSSNGVNFTTFKELYESPYKETKNNFTIFHNGSWVRGKVIKLPKKNMYRVTTMNNKEILVTEDHLNPTLRGDVRTDKLTTDDYLMFNTQQLDAVKEKDANLSYEQGFLIGMYLGDGSMANEDKESFATQIDLSINEEKYAQSKSILERACIEIGGKIFDLNKPYNNVYPLAVRDNKIASFIRNYVTGKYCFEKRLNMDCLFQSCSFRKGILDGFYLTDGGNSNRIYTTSQGLSQDIECLITSLGMQSVITVSDRTDEEVVIRGESFNRNYVLYCIRWYESTNRRVLKDIYKKQSNSIYFKIKSIEPYETEDDSVYCFEIENDEPYFTLPNGIITHNCRLKSDIKDLGYFNSIGGTALKVGSVKVSTVNLARLALDTNSEEEYLKELEHRVTVDLRALDVIRHIIKRNVEKGLLPNFSYGLIDFEHLYNTIGFIGIYETMKKFGYVTWDEFGNAFYTKEASAFGNKIFQTMRQAADNFIKENNCDYMINTEQIPGESAAAKLMRKDKFFYPDANIYDLPLYGNQFIPLGIQTTLQERVRIASEFDRYCNGGSILHANIDAPFDSFKKAWEMTNYIADQGVTYFAFNTRIQACKHNHAFYGSKCPVCGGDVETEYLRIVGFYTPIKTWSTERKQEYGMRRFHDVNKEDNLK